jgi:hypothetical protein
VISQWYELKPAALLLRRKGKSLGFIEKNLGIPRSTLSGWCKNIQLSNEQRVTLLNNQLVSLPKARLAAAKWHREQKVLRISIAKQEAENVMKNIDITDDILDLSLAMLYLGEGTKSKLTSIANSDPMVLRFVLSVLKQNYKVNLNTIKCGLHLRMDQDSTECKKYWANELGLAVKQFAYISFDKRSAGRVTYDRYKGVCVLYCGSIAIQRKLIYLYNLFCDKVSQMGT